MNLFIKSTPTIKEIDLLKAENDKLKKEVKKNNNESSKLSTLEKQCKNLQLSNRTLIDETLFYKNNIRELEKVKNEQNNKIISLENDLEAYKKMYIALKQENIELETKLDLNKDN